MLIPNTFAFHLTYACPHMCGHCCFNASKENKNTLPVEHVVEIIKRIEESVELIAFTGGEPFLLDDNYLAEVIKAASQRGFTTRVVTSAYFGKTINEAVVSLKKLKVAGLSEISISFDDFHEKYVSFDCVYNVFWAAVELDITPAVNVVQSKKTVWNADKVKKELGIDNAIYSEYTKDLVVESALNATGRAKSKLKDHGYRPERYIGPCPYVLLGPTLSATNKLLACCSVIPNTEELILDQNLTPDNLSVAINNGLNSALLNWLHLRGPYHIMKEISEKYSIEIPSKEEIGGNCEACNILFTIYKDYINNVVNEKRRQIFSELHLFDILNINKPETILKIWESDSTVIEMAPKRSGK